MVRRTNITLSPQALANLERIQNHYGIDRSAAIAVAAQHEAERLPQKSERREIMEEDLTIEVFVDRATFAECHGCDIPATMEAYSRMLGEELREAFPQATVWMSRANSDNDGRTEINGSPYREEDDAEIWERIDEIERHVYEDRMPEWAVPAP
jgi:hypothetical protein